MKKTLKNEKDAKNEKDLKQAGAELGQAQVSFMLAPH